MPRLIPTELLHSLQGRVECIRNVCILAHVDHGKTTLADSLIASNGIISERTAGAQRYMDSRPDEQEKGITMKSSSIALCYQCDELPFLINLVDSPGHVDFCGEVAAATRLCDGALIVVDVVEGVCPQTHAVLRQAWKEGLKPILVLNKIDRLITQLKFDSTHALRQLQQIVTQVNAIAGEMFLSDVLNQEDNAADESNNNTEDDLFDEEKEETLYFNPQTGNVVFASAIDGWAFQVKDFASLWAKKLNVKEAILQKTLWGDYYYDSKMKRIRKGAFTKNKKPLFVQMILDNIWTLYESVMDKETSQEKIDKILKSLDVQLLSRDRKHQDPRVRLKAVFHEWLPLSTAVLNSICTVVPSPAQMPLDRVKYMFDCPQLKEENMGILEDVCKANCEGETVVFVSKVVAVEKSSLPENRRNALNSEELKRLRQIALQKQEVQFACEPTTVEFDQNVPVHDYSMENIVFLAVCRVLSGRVSVGQELYIVGDGAERRVTVSSMYMLMGREMEHMGHTVKAGNIIAILGCELELNVSEPIIPFLETIVPLPKIDQVNENIEGDTNHTPPSKRFITISTANKKHEFVILAVPLPEIMLQLITSNEPLINNILDSKNQKDKIEKEMTEFRESLKKAVESVWRENRNDTHTFWGSINLQQALSLVNNIWSFGPKKARNNLLINCTDDYDRPDIWTDNKRHKQLREYDASVLSGFHVCCMAGPLCEEPVSAVAFIVKQWNTQMYTDSNDVYGPESGQIVATVKEGCKQAFQAQPQRLVAAMYQCTIQATSEVLGKVYAVLNRRRATIEDEEMREGTALFEIHASLPVVESFGFADDLRKKTSGLATPQLVFSHWQVVEQDPFWVPTTQEELVHFGEKSDAYNQASLYLNVIRKRKGLSTGEKIVIHAEKQRTLSKKV